MRLPALALLLCAIAACNGGGGDDAPDADGGPRTLSITSDEDLTPLAPSGPIRVYQGPQGGYHVFLSVRVTGLDPGGDQLAAPCGGSTETNNPCVDLEVRLDGAAEPIDFYVPLEVPLSPVPGQPGSFELRPPRLVQLDIGGLVDVEGESLTIHAEVTDRFQRSVTADVTAVAEGVPLGGLPDADAGLPDAASP